MSQIIIAKITDIPPGTAKQFEVNGKAVAIFNVGGTFYAIDAFCTHAEAPLCEGEVENNTITCPWHGAQFDLKTGEATCLPAVEGVKTYPVTVEGDTLKIEV